ncbi:MAG TPA: four helix bundle protein [Bacteroidota bacterium]|nr:four helix bundle protein [Bacteroidota bacterium]
MAESKDLRDRTKKFAVRVIRLVDQRSKSVSTDVIGRQLVRSATSIGANYRAACRGRSPAEFIAKLQIALEESDESMYWLELMLELDSREAAEVHELITEADELTAIFVSSLKTARSKL